ncbi:hypothetical protein PVAND_011865 [Polypedilum vanderplanki]|nr:hypothetical protein PVAND_011865 [Polypedilum vanderplanki]
MKLAKNIKGKEKTTNSSRKRKLFTNTSNIDEENFKDEENNAEQQLKETSQQTLLMDNESDHDIRTTVDEIRKSLDSLSNASSDFNAEIPCKTPKKSSSQFKEINEKIDNKKVSEQLKKRCRSPSTDKKLTKHKKKKNMHNDNDDEGFGSDNSRTDIKYDPNKNDNIRKGLRIRRYPKVWWRHDAEADNYGLVYRCYSKNDYLAEKKLKNSNMHKKEQHQVKKTSTKLKGVTKKQIKPKLSTINENGNSDNESNASEAVSTCSFKTATSRSETIKKVFDSYTLERNENIPSKTKITDSYDLQQISRLDWTQCGTDILYHQFIHTKNDGFIQFLPGAKKSKAKTKRSILKFVLLSGKIDFYVNNQIETLEHLGYISIQPGNIYSVQNPYEHPAILTFTKLDSSSSDLSISVE